MAPPSDSRPGVIWLRVIAAARASGSAGGLARLASPRMAALLTPGAVAGTEQARQAIDDHPRGDQEGQDDAYPPGHGRLWLLAAHGVTTASAAIVSAASTVECMPNSFDRPVTWKCLAIRSGAAATWTLPLLSWARLSAPTRVPRLVESIHSAPDMSTMTLPGPSSTALISAARSWR